LGTMSFAGTESFCLLGEHDNKNNIFSNKKTTR